MATPKAVYALGATLVVLMACVGLQFAMAADPVETQPAEVRGTAPDLLAELKSYPSKILFESFHDNNWEIFMMNADGSNPVNLTKTPDVDELYPKASPDGKKVCFVADEGKGREKVRNLYVMNMDGTGR